MATATASQKSDLPLLFRFGLQTLLSIHVILIHKCLPFILDKVVQDTEGRFVIITGFLYGERILIGSVYAPNTNDG